MGQEGELMETEKQGQRCKVQAQDETPTSFARGCHPGQEVEVHNVNPWPSSSRHLASMQQVAGKCMKIWGLTARTGNGADGPEGHKGIPGDCKRGCAYPLSSQQLSRRDVNDKVRP